MLMYMYKLFGKEVNLLLRGALWKRLEITGSEDENIYIPHEVVGSQIKERLRLLLSGESI